MTQRKPNFLDLLAMAAQHISEPEGEEKSADSPEPEPQAKPADSKDMAAAILGGIPDTYDIRIENHIVGSAVSKPKGDGWFLASVHPLDGESLAIVWARPPRD